MICDDLQVTWSSCTQFIFQFSFSSHLSLFIFFAAHLHTYAIEDVSVSRDSPRLTALIQMFPLYFSVEKNIAEILSD